jgi:arsenate reductase
MSVGEFPQAVLFCCDHNAVRSPMAEALMKKFYGQRAYVQSAGVKNDMEIDGFSVAVCAEMGIDLIIALSARSKSQALDLTKHYHLTVEYWPIIDPTSLGGDTREAKMAAYRQVRDQIRDKLIERFGPPTA